jgi:PPOX class probable F420-dependent enzyme
MASLTDTQLEFLRGNAFVGVATTVRADGSLHSTVVWVDVEDGDPVFLTTRARAKFRHLERDPRVSLLVVDPANAWRWVSVSGTVEISDEKAEARVDTMARKYLGQEVYPWRRPEDVWVDCRIRPGRVVTAGLE